MELENWEWVWVTAEVKNSMDYSTGPLLEQKLWRKRDDSTNTEINR